MKISSVNDVIWQKRHKFYKVSLLHAEVVRVCFQMTLFLSEHAAVYFIGQNSVCKYKKNNRVPAYPVQAEERRYKYVILFRK